MLDTLQLKFPNHRFPDTPASGQGKVLTNAECLTQARDFYRYSYVEGYRGSPPQL